ncbi:sensor histidine kinase [Amycolatopsis taiwanensis]|uniref:sensor histidine kinase n=1 Tax=Amycolatopsis taiwanensis TaxID=342230 RepID=UPI00069391E6|nr:HAMP domain-containing sensor histidine kinase [Amycolatopsis taiwanensis]
MSRPSSGDDRLIRRTALRMGIQSALVVAVAVALLCGVAVLVVLSSQHKQQEDLLTTTLARVDDVNDPPAGMWLVMQRGSHRAATPGMPLGLPYEPDLAATATDGMTRVAEEVRAGPHEYAVLTQWRDDYVVQAILDLRSAHQERDRLLRDLMITSLGGLVLAGVVGVWLGRRAVTPLAEALAIQRRFVADAGHELRTPLTLLSTRAQLLRRRARQGGDPVALSSDADDLVQDAAQLTEILEDLLLAADPRQEVPRQPVDLAELVRQAVAAAEPAAAEHGVALVVDSEPIQVSGYEAGLRRAVNALLDNGIRHARATLRVVVGPLGRQARVDFVDDGPGLDPAIMPTMFRRFASGPAEQAPGQRRRYGLGLSLVSDIAARHGGSVSARNADGGGAILRLLLPR